MSAPETSTPAGRLRIVTMLVANPAESHLDADTLPWVADRLRSDLPLLLELHSAVLRGDERRALELVNQLDGEQGETDPDEDEPIRGCPKCYETAGYCPRCQVADTTRRAQ